VGTPPIGGRMFEGYEKRQQRPKTAHFFNRIL